MKKLVLTMLVVALAIPAMAADISITADGVIQLTSVEGENVRGLAIVVESAEPITAVAKGDAVFNVFMDAAYEAETATPGSYVIGAGEPVADPDAKGTIALGGTKISLCMGALDETGNQLAVPAGTIDVATITVCGEVTITADALRGGIVGDAVVEGTIAGGTVVCGGPCVGDVDGNNYIYTDDLAALVEYLTGFASEYYYCAGEDPRFNSKMDVNGDGIIYTDDLSKMVEILTALVDSYYYADCP